MTPTEMQDTFLGRGQKFFLIQGQKGAENNFCGGSCLRCYACRKM